MAEAIRVLLDELPGSPGVYLFRDAEGDVIYVGKAKSLRSRVRSYFRKDATRDPKNVHMVPLIEDIETILVGSEADALILEATLIREHSPRFNVHLKDDRSYPYVKITVRERYPRVLVTRRLMSDGSRYFGPFTNVRSMRRALRVIRTNYFVRTCEYNLPDAAPDRPCLDYHIERCKAPCVGYQTESDYREMIDEIIEVLSGRHNDLRSRLQRDMRDASRNLDYEKAAELRDVLAGFDVLRTRQTAVDFRGGDRDVLGVFADGHTPQAVLLRVRDGHLLGRETRALAGSREASHAELVVAAIRGFYFPHGDIPAEILVPELPADHETLAEILGGRRGSAVAIGVPQRGQKRRLVELAMENARHVAEDGRAAPDQQTEETPEGARELRESLGLAEAPRALICFDVSTLGGHESVGSAVWLTDGSPETGEYRRFRIRSTRDGDVDDYAMMQEVVGRYFRRRVDEEGGLPDLVIIDGGRGQLGAALQGMESAGVSDLPVVALAKRLEEVFLPDSPTPIRLAPTNAGLRWLQAARDEAHRFAVSYNRGLRRRRTLRSELSLVAGVGPKREKELLRKFGSVAAIRRLTVDELASVPGIGRETASKIVDGLSTGTAP